MKKLKKITVLLLALILVSAMTSCAKKQEEQHIHKIGVVVYDLKDEQVQAFREYLEGYIGENFSDAVSERCNCSGRRRHYGIQQL